MYNLLCSFVQVNKTLKYLKDNDPSFPLRQYRCGFKDSIKIFPWGEKGEEKKGNINNNKMKDETRILDQSWFLIWSFFNKLN